MLQIKCNGQARPIVSRFEVPAPILASEFDWTDPAEDGAFFQYRGVWYSLEDFMRAPESLPGWDGYHGHSWFGGVVIRLTDDGESVICGTLFSRD
jgi:hypothetical protein